MGTHWVCYCDACFQLRHLLGPTAFTCYLVWLSHSKCVSAITPSDCREGKNTIINRAPNVFSLLHNRTYRTHEKLCFERVSTNCQSKLLTVPRDLFGLFGFTARVLLICFCLLLCLMNSDILYCGDYCKFVCASEVGVNHSVSLVSFIDQCNLSEIADVHWPVVSKQSGEKNVRSWRHISLFVPNLSCLFIAFCKLK